MKISTEWLRDYVELPESGDRLKEDLTMAGLAVESVVDHQGSPVMEFEITSNRPDCLSHYGVAREIAALYGRRLRHPAGSRRLVLPEERIPYAIEIRDPELCPRYVGLVMDGLRVGHSPEWMQRRLEAAGMRPLNNIVDITNYVLLELGHPLHAFDFNLLRGGRIIVDRARNGEVMVTLDGERRELDAEMLLINDGAGPVAIAGVMGGLNSEITERTRTVLLECAYFKPSSVRRTSKKLGLSTEASYRFERGADWDATVPAIARACYWIRKLAGGRIAGSMQDVYPRKLEPPTVELHRTRAEALLGVKLEDDFIAGALRRLCFRPVRTGKGRWKVGVPTYRVDVELEADLIEEIARSYGYQRIPTTHAPAVSAGLPSPASVAEEQARRLLLGLGYSEAVNLSFADKDDFHTFIRPGQPEPVRIQNPLTVETEYMRVSLIPGLVRAARRNFSYDQRSVRLFEIGHVYRDGPEGTTERTSLGILGTGGFTGVNWKMPAGELDFYHLSGVVEALFRSMRSALPELRPVDDIPWLDPTAAAVLAVDGLPLGFLGALHPALAEPLKVRQRVYVAEIDFSQLGQKLSTPIRYETLAKFPSVERDMSVLVPRERHYQEIRAGIWGLGIRELVELTLMDVYEGAQVPPGKVSMLLRLTFLDREGTLTVDRVQGFSDNIRTFLRDQIGAEFR
jgi:phenylalanyl-tRNA synthetase beta chain